MQVTNFFCHALAKHIILCFYACFQGSRTLLQRNSYLSTFMLIFKEQMNLSVSVEGDFVFFSISREFRTVFRLRVFRHTFVIQLQGFLTCLERVSMSYRTLKEMWKLYYSISSQTLQNRSQKLSSKICFFSFSFLSLQLLSKVSTFKPALSATIRLHIAKPFLFGIAI